MTHMRIARAVRQPSWRRCLQQQILIGNSVVGYTLPEVIDDRVFDCQNAVDSDEMAAAAAEVGHYSCAHRNGRSVIGGHVSVEWTVTRRVAQMDVLMNIELRCVPLRHGN